MKIDKRRKAIFDLMMTLDQASCEALDLMENVTGLLNPQDHISEITPALATELADIQEIISGLVDRVSNCEAL